MLLLLVPPEVVALPRNVLNVLKTTIWIQAKSQLILTTRQQSVRLEPTLVQQDSSKIAESLMPLPIRTIGAVSVLLVTKDLTLVPDVTVHFSVTVPAVNPDGSMTPQMAVSSVTPNARPAQVLVT